MGDSVVTRILSALGYERRSAIMDDLLAGRRAGAMSAAGVPVNAALVAGIPAVHAAVTFAAESVASLPMRIWRGEGPARERVTGAWQSRLFRGSPNPVQDTFNFWETVQSSLDFRSNAYIWKSKDTTGKTVRLWALHPDQVSPSVSADKAIVYDVHFGGAWVAPEEATRYGSVRVDNSTILHIPGRGGMGQLVSPSPISLFRTSLGIIAAKQQYEATIYRHGAAGGLVVSFPAGITKSQADQWRESFDGEHAGVYNAGKTKVVGGGATVTAMGLTQKDAEFVEAMALSVMDVSRIFRVPAWFLGIDAKTDKPVSPEHEQDRWMRHGLVPRLHRIEAAINADPDLFGAAEIYAAFDTSGMIRGDLATEAEISLKKVQSGQWLIDEARAKDGLPPLPDGLGMVPHPVPVGGSPYGVPLPAKKEDVDE
ncbi:MAG: hypothetical protein DDT37_01665 [Firmicutes bacterium]|nr:hypothetical protein [candidate division NPL-UPA2 bacterium]